MDISCAFATSPETPVHIAVAEELGYRRAWCYDSPALYPDVWVVLALAAQRTSRIGLGPAVLVPSLRHPMVNAAAIATLAALAPGRVAVTIGAGFTGRFALGQRPMRWSDVADYTLVLRALLRGEEPTWDGAVIRMIHPDGFVPPRPIDDVPILIGGDGPRGRAVAREVGDGLFSAAIPPPSDEDLPDWRALLVFGTVVEADEPLDSERVVATAGPALAVAFHAMYERRGDAIDKLPGGAEWRTAVESVDSDRRHLAIHEDHLVRVTERELPSVHRAAPLLLPTFTLTGTADQIRDRVAAYREAGITELAFQPAGPDIPRELERFKVAASP